MGGNPEDVHMGVVAGPSTINHGEEVEDMFKTEVYNEEGESAVNIFDHRAFTYPGNNFLDDCVEENNETGDKDDDDEEEEDIVFPEEILDQADLESADISDLNDDLGITISERPIFEGSPLTLTMPVIAIITFAMTNTEHLSGRSAA